MRLFTAIELTDDARGKIAAEQARLRRALGRGARPVRPEHMHLTLAFIGETPEARGAAIVGAMEQPLAMTPFTVAFGGIGVFPPRGAPRVLWLGVREGEAAMIELYREVADRLSKLDVEAERRPYHPHLTLARWRESRPSDRPAPDRASPTVVARIDVSFVTLFESRLSSTGPAYTALARAPLSGAVN